jgi:hypothetical protein
MLSNLCLSFIALTGTQHIRHPEEVMRTLKARVMHQWQSQDSGLTLEFDNPNCAFQGSYFFNEEQMVLSADHEHWRGRLEGNFTDILEGRSLEFSRVRPHSFRTQSLQSRVSTNNTPALWKSWLPWTLAIVGVTAGTYMWVERERHIQELKGLKISF